MPLIMCELVDERRPVFDRPELRRDRLSIDVEPQELAAQLVNRYHQVKRAGLL